MYDLPDAERKEACISSSSCILKTADVLSMAVSQLRRHAHTIKSLRAGAHTKLVDCSTAGTRTHDVHVCLGHVLALRTL